MDSLENQDVYRKWILENLNEKKKMTGFYGSVQETIMRFF